MNKTLIVTLMVLVALTAIESRRHKKSKKAKTKYNGDGSYDTEYSMPGFKCKVNYNDLDNNPAQGEKAKFKAKDLENPKNLNKLGLVIKNINATGDLAKISVKSGNGLYVPYRWFVDSCSWVNPSGDFKYSTLKVINDNNESINFRIFYPFAYTTWYISDNQLGKICTNIKINLNNAKNAVNTCKGECNEFCSLYKLNKNALAQAQENGANIDKLIEDATKESDALDVQIKAIEDEIAGQLEQKSQKKQEIDAKNLENQNASQIMAEKKLQEETLKNSLAQLESQDSSQLQSLQANQATYESDLQNARTALIKLVPTRESEITAAVEAAKNGNVDELNNLLNSIIS